MAYARPFGSHFQYELVSVFTTDKTGSMTWFSSNMSTGWWFGTCFILPYIGKFIIPTDELHHFSEGIPPAVLHDMMELGSQWLVNFSWPRFCCWAQKDLTLTGITSCNSVKPSGNWWKTWEGCFFFKEQNRTNFTFRWWIYSMTGGFRRFVSWASGTYTACKWDRSYRRVQFFDFLSHE